MKKRSIAIKKKLEKKFLSKEVEIFDETYLHKGHDAYTGEEETHLHIVICADIFNGMTRLQRHRSINNELEEYFSQGLHAIKISAYGTSETIPE